MPTLSKYRNYTFIFLLAVLTAWSGKVWGQSPDYSVPQPIIGANILGNVYGGGNHAKVTGNTNVQIGL